MLDSQTPRATFHLSLSETLAAQQYASFSIDYNKCYQYSEWLQGSDYYRRQLVMFIVDNVVEEDRRMLLVNELESITLLGGTTPAFCPTARDAFAIFEDL
jgi:hypothetical protein